MMKKQTLTSIALIAIAISSGAAMAAEGNANGNGRFMKYFDTNGDGSVDMAEFNTAAAERFKKRDADNNGHITR